MALEAIRSGRLAPVDDRRTREIVYAVAGRGVLEARELAEAYRDASDDGDHPALAWACVYRRTCYVPLIVNVATHRECGTDRAVLPGGDRLVSVHPPRCSPR